MKVKDLSQPLFSGRMGNLIYYVRNGVQCVRRAEVPGKMAHNLFNSTNCRCFSGEGKLVDFVNFTFTKGNLLLPVKTEALIRIANISGSEPSPLIHSI